MPKLLHSLTAYSKPQFLMISGLHTLNYFLVNVFLTEVYKPMARLRIMEMLASMIESAACVLFLYPSAQTDAIRDLTFDLEQFLNQVDIMMTYYTGK